MQQQTMVLCTTTPIEITTYVPASRLARIAKTLPPGPLCSQISAALVGHHKDDDIRIKNATPELIAVLARMEGMPI